MTALPAARAAAGYMYKIARALAPERPPAQWPPGSGLAPPSSGGVTASKLARTSVPLLSSLAFYSRLLRPDTPSPKRQRDLTR
eukprot:CAMPEP_0119465330 /NCGR_PEP_ID=MMETSP1344-20130328/507_1 /TAXON_ID=236787 /ORGANISM="Florenciella parvula, Strain CCMP2471" /LENGTH=82 /DNA_ID=CAMNT_0007497579 /DNA_START=48 /DNA_END=297 /DNA_ORIENTATION=+